MEKCGQFVFYNNTDYFQLKSFLEKVCDSCA